MTSCRESKINFLPFRLMLSNRKQTQFLTFFYLPYKVVTVCTQNVINYRGTTKESGLFWRTAGPDLEKSGFLKGGMNHRFLFTANCNDNLGLCLCANTILSLQNKGIHTHTHSVIQENLVNPSPTGPKAWLGHKCGRIKRGPRLLLGRM